MAILPTAAPDAVASALLRVLAFLRDPSNRHEVRDWISLVLAVVALAAHLRVDRRSLRELQRSRTARVRRGRRNGRPPR